MKLLTQEEFINKCLQIAPQYDYSKVHYINSKTKVCIICPIHGEFWQTPNSFLSRKRMCPQCGKINRKLKLSFTLEEFINKARKIHGDKYIYSKVEYINNYTKVCIICPEHGEFWQTPREHLRNQGCPKCHLNYLHNENILTTEEFIERAIEIHGNRYVYSKVNYIDSKTKVCIICPNHGEFSQTPNSHLQGQGCPFCNQSKLERTVEKILKENDIKYLPQYKEKWLKNKNELRLDFYLPEYNVAIECQGKQHFEPVEYLGGEKEFEQRRICDVIKYDLCKEHGIKILYFSLTKKYNDFLSEKLIKTEQDLINEIFFKKKLLKNLDIPKTFCNFAVLKEFNR